MWPFRLRWHSSAGVLLAAPPAMDQQSLRAFWLDAPEGRLCPWEQAKALGLREASRELHGGKTNLPWIAARISKVGGGHPQKGSLHEFFKLVDADKDWFPGKHNGAKRGRKPDLTPAKRRRIAQSAMTAKTHGNDPCVAAVVAACPEATRNESTGVPFCDKTIRKVFTEDCYDFEPTSPWKFQTPLQKVFLPTAVKQHRLTMASRLLRRGPSAAWWAQHVVWFDPCCSVIPGSQRQYDKMRQACKGQKRFISDDAKLYSPNLRGPKTALKQTQWEGRKVNWFMVLARGVVHVEVMPETWSLDGNGLAAFVQRLPGVLRKMLGPEARLPRTVFTDRGTGMYIPSGKIVAKYEAAIAEAGFKVYWGPDATPQSPDMGDLLLHETAVAWFRQRMKAERPEVAPWEETQAQWAKRARKAVKYINDNYDVPALSGEFPQRLRDTKEAQGERLRK